MLDEVRTAFVHVRKLCHFWKKPASLFVHCSLVSFTLRKLRNR